MTVIDRTDTHARYLLASLVALHLLSPISAEIGGQTGLLITLVSYVAVLLAGAVTLGGSRKMVWISALLSAPPLIVGSIQIGNHIDRGDLLIPASAAPMLIVVASLLFGHVLRPVGTTLSRLYASGAVYLLMANSWAALFSIVEYVRPGSFKVPDGVVGNGDLYYFSVVTITTLGYGDITPVTRLARSLCSLEAVVGLFFVAIVVARLVTVAGAERDAREQ